MRIRQVTTAVVEANYDWTIVRVESDEGVLGWGEAFCAPGLPETIRELAPLIEGRDARHVEPLVRRLHLATAHVSERRHRVPRDLGDRGRALGPRGPVARGSAVAALRRLVPRPRPRLRRLPRGRGVDELQRDTRRPAAAVDDGRDRGGRYRARGALVARGGCRRLHAGGVRDEGARDGRPRLHGAEVRSRPPPPPARGPVRADDLRRPARAPARTRRGDGRGRRGSGRGRVRPPLALRTGRRSAARPRARAPASALARGSDAASGSRVGRANRRAHDDADLHRREPLPPRRVRGAHRPRRRRHPRAGHPEGRRACRHASDRGTRGRALAAAGAPQHRRADRHARVGARLRLDPELPRARVARRVGAVLRRAPDDRRAGDRGRLHHGAGSPGKSARSSTSTWHDRYARPGAPFFDEPT